MSGCQHKDFKANVSVHGLTEDEGPVKNWSADVMIKCAQCGQPFRFKGALLGLSFSRPMMSPNGEELRCPIEPSDDTLQGDSAALEMPEGHGRTIQ